MTRRFIFIPCLVLASLLTSCDETINSNGEAQCLDDFLKSLGEDRSRFEAEAEKRGIESSELLFEVYNSLTGISDALFDCSASEQYTQIAKETAGSYSEAKSPVKALDQIEDYLLSVRTDSVDVVFLIDATGSMSDDISEVKSRLATIVHSMSNKKINVSCAIYRDLNVDEIWYARTENDLAATTNEILGFLAQIEADGGEDFPESMFDATVKTASELFWMSSKRLLIVLTDAPPLTGSKSEHSIENVVEVLIANKVIPVIVLVSLV